MAVRRNGRSCPPDTARLGRRRALVMTMALCRGLFVVLPGTQTLRGLLSVGQNVCWGEMGRGIRCPPHPISTLSSCAFYCRKDKPRASHSLRSWPLNLRLLGSSSGGVLGAGFWLGSSISFFWVFWVCRCRLPSQWQAVAEDKVSVLEA